MALNYEAEAQALRRHFPLAWRLMAHLNLQAPTEQAPIDPRILDLWHVCLFCCRKRYGMTTS